jgi:NTP pyrophosphatase (non-canonical NTP hydrolase)
MTIEQAQATVDEWITTTGVRYFSELTNMAILTEEVGEVARLIARQYGEQRLRIRTGVGNWATNWPMCCS